MSTTTRNLPASTRLWNKLDSQHFTPFDTIFDTVVADLYPDMAGLMNSPFGKVSYPKVDVREYDDHVEIEAELAGMKKDDINVEWEDKILTISGKTSRTTDSNARYLMRELKRSMFKRSFLLGDDFDEDNIDATFEDGILTVSIKKRSPSEKSNGRKIEVRSVNGQP